ncbi:hypothetical protein V2W45_1364099 [Cenococcum geophilum]
MTVRYIPEPTATNNQQADEGLTGNTFENTVAEPPQRCSSVSYCSWWPEVPEARRSESKAGCDALEIRDTNKAFHWAGLIYLCRRVLGKPTTDPDVHIAVGGIVSALLDVRQGSSAEACQFFPMITAGCNAWNPVHWNKIMERLQSLEGFGMAQGRLCLGNSLVNNVIELLYKAYY